MFSWAKLEDLESLLSNEQIEPLVPNKENYQEFLNSPYLLKLLLTNFSIRPKRESKGYKLSRQNFISARGIKRTY
ncbi:MAG: hypothetical protein HC912_07620 [Saprospiraceae bacterium]|nr:hypothetical protein [Saprospiraceae bacterium]